MLEILAASCLGATLLAVDEKDEVARPAAGDGKNSSA
jgi:hypothetical protein